MRVPYHLKIDSGMGRLGTRAGAGRNRARACAPAPAPLEGLMTHFASSANYESRADGGADRAFRSGAGGVSRTRGIAPEYVHLSSTIPVAYRRAEAWGNLVRPGHAIYGYVSPGARSGSAGRARGDSRRSPGKRLFSR